MSLMNFFPRIVLASVLPVILAAAPHATTIFTPPVIPDDDGTFSCLVTNVSLKTVVAKIDVLDLNRGTTGHVGFTIPPLENASGARPRRVRRSLLPDHR
jgi:hypothetical protein